MKHSKKILSLALACVLLLGLLAGCSGNTPSTGTQGNNNDNSTTNSNSGNETANGEPTEEESKMLLSYVNALNSLHRYAAGLTSEETKDDDPIKYEYVENGERIILEGSEALARYYSDIEAMAAVDGWINKEGYLVENYGLDAALYCDRQTLLSRFTVVKDVLIRQDFTYKDELGNKNTGSTTFYYDAQGRIIWAPAKATTGSSSAPCWSGGDTRLAWYTIVGNMANSTLEYADDACICYDETGKIEKIQYSPFRKGDGSIADDLRHMVSFTYNDTGRVSGTNWVGYTKLTWNFTYSGNEAQAVSDNTAYGTYTCSFNEKNLLTKEQARNTACDYTYDSNGHIASITYIYTRSKDFEAKTVYNFTCDAEGKILSVEIDYGTKATHMSGEKYREYDSMNMYGSAEYVYGDYFIYGE